jgi:hypothetical protein
MLQPAADTVCELRLDIAHGTIVGRERAAVQYLLRLSLSCVGSYRSTAGNRSSTGLRRPARSGPRGDRAVREVGIFAQKGVQSRARGDGGEVEGA